MPKPECECIHISFHKQVDKTPHAVCLIDQDGTELTYKQVQREVLLLAQELRQHEARANAVVAIFMEPSADYVISMLAILSAGAAYVPLELAYPTTMLQRVLADAVPAAVITKTQHRNQLPRNSCAVICMDDREHHVKEKREQDTHEGLLELYKSWPAVSLDDLAFVVYSSGTTGQPKGIANPHRAPALSYDWRFREVVDYDVGDRVACHVFFVWEAVRPVMRGGAVVPVPSSVVFDGDELSLFLQRHKVTEMLFTPSLLENVLTTLSKQDLQARLASLKTIILNGEVVSLALREKCLDLLPHVRFVNLYSISECHEVGAVDLTEMDLNLSNKFCPVGKPCSVSPVYILDEEETLVEEGEAGELYVGGDMLAVGYLNLPELTATRFLPDPFVDKEETNNSDNRNHRMYRTGDRARILPNGHLEILGRCDFMVKIRGYSIVLGAVEAALTKAISLASCVVVADGEEGDEKHLVAYLVRAPSSASDNRLVDWSIDTRTGSCLEIRRAVDAALPHYMIPSVFIEVESLPVSAVGAKLDRKALQKQTADRRAMLRSLQFSAETHSDFQGNAALSQRCKRLAKYLRVPLSSPKEDLEDAMASIWEAVLDRDPGSLTPDSDFHECGGHSLSSARLASLVNQVFSTKVVPVQLMQGTTIRQLCEWMLSGYSKDSNILDSDNKDSHSAGSAETISEEDDLILQRVRESAVLPNDVVPKEAATVRGLGDSQHVFLTGATGYLGAHILAELLHKYPSSMKITCLVRSDKQAVWKNLERYELADPESFSRVEVARGDLSLPHLGLDDSTWDELAASVDAVIHCGAAVSLTAPYSMLESVNVKGTLEVLRLVCACAAGTSLVYVSSNGIFPRDKGAEEVFLENGNVSCLPDRLGANDGYGLSKWSAECLVVAAQKRGMPAMVIRYGNIGWQSTTGIGNALDFQSMILNGSRRMLARPDVAGWKLEVTPVDFAASSLVALADSPEQTRVGAIFHCVQSEFIEAEKVFDWVSKVDQVSLAALPFEEWAKRVEVASHEDADLTALNAFTLGLRDGAGYLAEIAHLDCSKFEIALAALPCPVALPPPSLAEQYYRTYLQRNPVSSLAAPPETIVEPVMVDPFSSLKSSGPLAGKVAVVTGASSGIGRAIVLELVKAGCHVAMGARRLSELEKTRKEVASACPGSSAKTLSVRTDVTKRQDVASLVKATESALGPVDIMVNNAGVMYFTLMKNIMWDQWDAQVDVNCKGTLYGIGSVLPSMLQRGTGHIVNITSDAGRKSFPGLGVYSGSKFFVEAVSQALRAETASSGLRVTCIQPGNVETPLLSKSTDPEGLAEYGTPSGAKVLEPCDVGRAVVYALSQPEWCAVNEVLVEPREEPA